MKATIDSTKDTTLKDEEENGGDRLTQSLNNA